MNSFKILPKTEKPRERFLKYGVENLTTEDLISIILKTGSKSNSIKEVTNNLLIELKDIKNLKNMTVNSLIKIKGIGIVKATSLIAALELGRRVYYEEEISLEKQLTDPSVIYKYFKNIYDNKHQEEFYVLFLNNKKKYISKKMLFKGTINMSLVHPREVFKEAYLLSASFIICIHNHPSGDVKPSIQDIEITNVLKEIGLIHGIKVVDHIIIGNNNYYSFYENNQI